MIKRSILLGALCAIILITACIDSTTVISVRKDGSGMITETIYIDKSVKDMMEGMFAQMNSETEDEAEDAKLLDLDQYREKAPKLGEGVKFLSAKEITREDGSTGTQVTYSFDDIRKLNISAQPDNPMGDSMADMMGGEPAEEAEDDAPITFDFIKGGTSTLIIKMPKKEEPESSEDITMETEEAPEISETPAVNLGMIRQMFAGFRIQIMIELLDGKIQKTNSSFVERIDGRDTITLLDMELGKILKDEKLTKDLNSMSKIMDMNTVMEKMKDIPGLKIETQETIEIKFK